MGLYNRLGYLIELSTRLAPSTSPASHVFLNRAEGPDKEMAGNENEANKVKRESGPETVVNIGQYAQNYQRQTQVWAVTYEPNIKLHKPLFLGMAKIG